MSVFDPEAKLYCMVLEHEVTESLEVGARGSVEWPEGWLYYVGRSQYGWGSRAKRLLEPSRNRHWHIDYFQTSQHATLRLVLPIDVDPDRECEFAEFLRSRTTLTPIEEGLGGLGLWSRLPGTRSCGGAGTAWSYADSYGVDLCSRRCGGVSVEPV